MAKVTSITNARKYIYKIAEEVNEVHEEVFVYNASTGKNVVIMAEEDWNAIKETLNIMNVQGLADSIISAGKEALSDGIVYDPKEEW